VVLLVRVPLMAGARAGTIAEVDADAAEFLGLLG